MTDYLNDPYPLKREAIDFFRENGFVKLKNVFDANTIERYANEINRLVIEKNPLAGKPMEERDTYEKAFIQITNLWRTNDLVREFVFSRRLARIAAELLGVDGVRLYHDQALYKEPDGGITPWHADQYYWPLSNTNTCTAWVPLQETPFELGPLAFSAKSHRVEIGRDLKISDESESFIRDALKEHGLETVTEPFELGEVSFHYGWTFHHAAANTSDRARAVMTMIYMEDGIRLTELQRSEHEDDRNHFMPGAEPGDVVQTELNPLLYERVSVPT